MGWYGNWDIRYNGQNSKKFVDLAKLIIPNYVKRFEETEEGRLECKRSLSWYSADIDIAQIMQYLDEKDSIDVLIDGESHPIRRIIDEGGVKGRVATAENYDWAESDRKTGMLIYHLNDEYREPEIEYYDYEKQTFRKEDGKVIIDNEHPDDERYTVSTNGIQEMLAYTIVYPENTKGSELEGNTDTLDSYIKYIAQQLSENDEIMPAVQDFVYTMLDPQKLRDLANKEYSYDLYHVTPDETVLAQIASVREQFKTVESAKAYLEQIKTQNPEIQENKQETERKIPNFIANMSKRDINNLGGLEQLLNLVELKGEDTAKEVLSMLGYKINDNKVQEEPSLEDLEFEKTALEYKEKQAQQLYQEYEEQLPDREEDKNWRGFNE